MVSLCSINTGYCFYYAGGPIVKAAIKGLPKPKGFAIRMPIPDVL
jgi:hypothetical protein